MKEYVGISETATNVNPTRYAKASAAMQQYSQTFRNAALSTGMFEAEQIKLNSATDTYIKNLNKQKISFKQYWKERNTVAKAAYKEQLAMQQSYIKKMPGLVNGKQVFDVVIPNEVNKELDTLGRKFAWVRENVKSASTQMVNWGKNTQWAGRQLMVGFTIPMAAFAAASGVMAYKVNENLTRIQKVYNTTFNSMSKDSVEAARAQQELAKISSDAFITAKDAAKQYGASVTDTLDVQAQLAAVGEKGAKLQSATTQVMKAATLGEMDYNTALQATISMQSIFHMSSKKLADTWNYMNSVENATSLSMQDFATAIPIAAGPIQAMGGDMKTLGLLMTSMKERGVSAAQGANAIKAAMQRLLRPSQQVKKEFAELTGTSFDFIQKKNKGNLLGMLQSISDLTEHMTKMNANKVFAGLFGAWQVTRMRDMIEGLRDLKNGTGQVSEAFKIGEQSTKQWANTSDKEVRRFQESAAGQFKIAINTIKAELSEMGKPFLTIATDVVKTLTWLIGKFNDLPDTMKKGLAGLAIGGALMGPLVMLSGLTLNFAGNLVKAGVAATGLFTKMEILDRENFIAKKAAELASAGFTTMGDSMATLQAHMDAFIQAQGIAIDQAGMVEKTTVSEAAALDGEALAAEKAAQGWRDLIASRQARGLPVPQRAVDMATQREVDAIAYRGMADDAKAGKTAQTSAAVADSEKKKALAGKAFAVSAAAAAVSMGVQAVNSNETVDNIANMVMYAAMLAPVVGMVPWGKMAEGVGLMGTRFTGVIKSMKGGFLPALRAGKSGIADMVVSFGRFVGPAGILAAAIAGFIVVNKKIHETADRMEDLTKTGSTWADIFGYTERKPGTFIDPKTGKEVKTLTSLVQELNDKAPSVGESIRKAMENAGKGISEAKAEADALDIAIQQGLKVKATGGTAEEARQAVKAALMAGIQDINKVNRLMAQVDLDVKFNVDWQVVREEVKQTMKQIQQSVDGWDTKGKVEFTMDLITGQEGDSSTASDQAIKSAADTFYQKWSQVNDKLKIDMVRQLQAANSELQTNAIKPYFTNPSAQGVLKKYNITNGSDFYKKALSQTFTDDDIAKLDKSGAKYKDIFDTLVEIDIRNQDFTKELAKQANLEDSGAKNLDQLLAKIVPHYRTINQAQAEYATLTQGNNKFINKGLSLVTGEVAGHKKLNDAQKLVILNTLRSYAGLEKTGNLLDGFGPVTKAWSAKTNGVATAVTGVNNNLRQTKSLISSISKDDIISLAQGAMSSFESGVADATTASYTKKWDAQMAAVEAAGQRRIDAMQNRHQNALDAFDAHWAKREKSVENGYDHRIKKIQDEMDAEKKADDLRQKLFEREMTRLDRLAQSANQNIDFNVALNSGNFDEAAKIRNDAEAQAADWTLQDAQNAGSDKSQNRQDKLQKQIDRLDKIKQKRLDNMKEVEAKERKALERSQKRQEDALQRQVDAAKAAEQEKLDAQKAALDEALKHFTGYTATSTKDLQKHIKDWEARYKGFNLTTTGEFNTTTKNIAAYLKKNLEDSRAEFANQKEWATSGFKIANAMLKGAFGMNTQQFKQWLISGVWPNKSQPPTASDVSKMYGGGAKGALRNHVENGPGGRTIMHTGGMIGKDKGGRVGYARTAPVHRNEVPLLAEKGEYVVNKNAAREHAPLLSAINNNSLSPAMGVYQEKSSAVRNEKGGAGGTIGAMGFSGLMGSLMAKAIMSTVQTGIASGAMNAINQQSMIAGGSFSTAKPGVYGDVSLTAEQLKNAAIIASVGSNMGMSKRDITVGLMTALQESGLRNLHYGDRDSQGLFQQRPSAGWGTVAQVTNPKYASTKFFESLKRIGNRDSMPLTLEAQAVQRSAFPYAYAKWENEARAILAAMHKSKSGKYSATAPTSNVTGPATGVGRRAIGWASARLGDSGWYNLCQSFVRQSLGAPGGAPSAIAAWNNARYKHRSSPSSVPAGVPVFWSGGSYGHTALSTGGGNVISTDYPVMGRVGRGTIAGISRDWNKHFLGWTEDENGKRVWGLPGLKTGGFTLSDGMAMLHEGEAVMTKPLTQEFHDGVKNFANGGNNTYNINVNVTQPNASADQIAVAVKRSLRREEARKPQSRKQ